MNAPRIPIVLLALALAGCSSLLPKEDTITQSGWQTFDEARGAYDRIVPGVTDAIGLAELGLDPFKDPNIAILNYADLVRRLAGNASGAPDYLDPAVRDCVLAREGCRAYEVDIKHVERKREGNFWVDFLNFRRMTNITGWRFNAVLVLKGDRVVYKLWSGLPATREVENVHHPLGPLQGIGESLRPSIN